MPLPEDYDPKAEQEFWRALEDRIDREDELFESRRHEPLEGLGRAYRASEEGDDGLV